MGVAVSKGLGLVGLRGRWRVSRDRDRCFAGSRLCRRGGARPRRPRWRRRLAGERRRCRDHDRRRARVLRIRDRLDGKVDEVVIGVLARSGHAAGEPFQTAGRRRRRRRLRLEPGARRAAPPYRVDRGGRALGPKRHASAGCRQSVRIRNVRDAREEAGGVRDQQVCPRRQAGSAKGPCRLARDRRAGGGHVDDLQALERLGRRGRVVELDEFVRSAGAAGHHLAHHEVVGRRARDQADGTHGLALQRDGHGLVDGNHQQADGGKCDERATSDGRRTGGRARHTSRAGGVQAAAGWRVAAYPTLRRRLLQAFHAPMPARTIAAHVQEDGGPARRRAPG